MTPCIPSGRSRNKRLPSGKRLDKKRHQVENLLARLKDWRPIATRSDRCVHIFFLSAVLLVATIIFWLWVLTPASASERRGTNARSGSSQQRRCQRQPPASGLPSPAHHRHQGQHNSSGNQGRGHQVHQVGTFLTPVPDKRDSRRCPLTMKSRDVSWSPDPELGYQGWVTAKRPSIKRSSFSWRALLPSRYSARVSPISSRCRSSMALRDSRCRASMALRDSCIALRDS